MFTVALIGPDGCGKSTIARAVAASPPVPLRYIYMGVNLESSNVVLPTTWLILTMKRLLGARPDMAGPPDPTRQQPPSNPIKRAWKSTKRTLRILNLVAEEWFRQLLIWHHKRRGYVVLCDRHFFCDYYAYDVTHYGKDQPVAVRLHGYLLDRFYPRPDLTIYLDAPAELLYSRKGEGSPELLELRCQEYRGLAEVLDRFEQVDASSSLEDSSRQVAELIMTYNSDRVHC